MPRLREAVLKAYSALLAAPPAPTRRISHGGGRGSLILCVPPDPGATRHVNLHHQRLAGAQRHAASCLLQVRRGAAGCS